MSVPHLSVVVPVFNERDNVAPLINEITAALRGLTSFEIVYVDDCSRDDTLDVLKKLKADVPELRVIKHVTQSGQSTAVRNGVKQARGAWIATLDGDGQNDPAGVRPLFEQLTRVDAPSILAMVAGERVNRQDVAAKKTASRLANSIRRRLLDDGAADTGCGLKLFYRDAYLRLPYFDHSHRYLPAMMRREGFAVEFSPVGHRPRAHGASKYTNLGRLAVAFRDILGVVWLKARARSPLTISEVEPAHACDKVERQSARGAAPKGV